MPSNKLCFLDITIHVQLKSIYRLQSSLVVAVLRFILIISSTHQNLVWNKKRTHEMPGIDRIRSKCVKSCCSTYRASLCVMLFLRPVSIWYRLCWYKRELAVCCASSSTTRIVLLLFQVVADWCFIYGEHRNAFDVYCTMPWYIFDWCWFSFSANTCTMYVYMRINYPLTLCHHNAYQTIATISENNIILKHTLLNYLCDCCYTNNFTMFSLGDFLFLCCLQKNLRKGSASRLPAYCNFPAISSCVFSMRLKLLLHALNSLLTLL